MVNDVLIEARVELVAGRLSCTEWMRPKATARWLEKCSTLIGSGTGAWLFIWDRMARIVIRFQISRQCTALLAVLVCRYFRSYTEFQLIADGDIIINLDISRL